jgi:hypothetical protein
MRDKLSSSSLIVIDKLENLSQMQALVSTEKTFDRLNISIQSEMIKTKQADKDMLEELINIKYMKLVELKISM